MLRPSFYFIYLFFWSIHFNIFLHLCFGVPSSLIRSRLSTKIVHAPHSLPILVICSVRVFIYLYFFIFIYVLVYEVAYFGNVSVPKILYAPHSLPIVGICSVRPFIY
jgi:hypothetical protein